MCVLAAVAVGGTTVQAQQYNSEPVMNEIAAIRQELEILQRQVYREQNDGISNPRSAADIAVKIGEFDEKLRRLSGQVDEANYKIRQLENKIELINKDVDVRIKMIEGKPVSGNGGAVSASAAENLKRRLPLALPKRLPATALPKVTIWLR